MLLDLKQQLLPDSNVERTFHKDARFKSVFTFREPVGKSVGISVFR